MKPLQRQIILTAVGILAMGVLGRWTTLFAAEKPAVPTLSQLVIPESCVLSGRVMQSDGAAPVPGALIRVRSARENKIILTTKADNAGFYRLIKLPQGNYSVIYEERAQVNIRVVPGTAPEMGLFNVSLPTERPTQPQQIPEAAPAPEGGSKGSPGKK